MSQDDGPVLLYDGLCGFCDRTVRLLLRVDRRGVFRFAPLGGTFASDVLSRHPHIANVDSVVLVEPISERGGERVWVRSAAILRTAKRLGGGWRLLAILTVIPRPLRDWGYDVFARCRYRLFGRFEACPVPPPEVRGRFLD